MTRRSSAIHVDRDPRAGFRMTGGWLFVVVKWCFALAGIAAAWTAVGNDAPVASDPRSTAAASHWAFQPLRQPAIPVSPGAGYSPLDRFVAHRLQEVGLAPGPEAERTALIRRVAFTLTGLPPTPAEIEAFIADSKPDAYDRLTERYLASPHYGERWGQHWLDATGYADSNGYFNADSDRPLAYRYRDYVIRSLNRDRPFTRFVQEQLAGDELSDWKPGEPVTPEIIELLEATHFLRNGQDGSGESDGNPDEVRTDRYYALESSMQIIGSSLLGLTLQCAKCHDHKFEPVTQKDYYAFQAVLYPAFNIEKWINPNDRIVDAPMPDELKAWQNLESRLNAEHARVTTAFHAWVNSNRPPGKILFTDTFETNVPLAAHWSNTAPGDDQPGGSPAVRLDASEAPAAEAKDGNLRIIEGGGAGDRWLSTQAAFDWRPAQVGQWIQATFDLVATKLTESGQAAERVGYFLATHDFNDNSSVAGGNLLIDGNPGGATSVQVDYPGADAKSRGTIGTVGYRAGHNFGARITRTGTNEFTLEHLVDGAVDGGGLKLTSEDLPSGGFGFEYCCGRSFVVDNVLIESSNDEVPGWTARQTAYQAAFTERKMELDRTTKAINAERAPKPGRIAWMTDVSPVPPEVHLLKRGNHKTPGEVVEPDFPIFLKVSGPVSPLAKERPGKNSSGRRLAWVQWLTAPDSRQASLLARVTVNRVWQQYFGIGLVATPDNFGLSGAPPSDPQLLDWLAGAFIESGWSLKALHREILRSATFRQSSAPRPDALAADPANSRYWRYPIHRLDAEAVRDAMLAASGRLGAKAAGPYVPTPRNAEGEVIVEEVAPEAFSRSVFLQHRRTQVPTLLGTFDAPSVVFNCTRRASTTMPLQSLSLLNSEFAVRRGSDLAQRLERDAGGDLDRRLRLGFVLTCGREPDRFEYEAALRFVAHQRSAYAPQADAEKLVWADLSQSWFGLNAFLYLE